MWSALGYIEMSENCCLCQCELTDSTSRKRRKKLYGKSAEKSREVLEALTEEKLHVIHASVCFGLSSNSPISLTVSFKACCTTDAIRIADGALHRRYSTLGPLSPVASFAE